MKKFDDEWMRAEERRRRAEERKLYSVRIWWELQGIPPFRPDHFRDAGRLVARLQEPDDAAAGHVRARLSDRLREELKGVDPERLPAEVLGLLPPEFDSLQEGPSLYDERCFPCSSLPAEALTLSRQTPQWGDDLIRLNRLLLEAAFPCELKPSKGFNDSIRELARHAAFLLHGRDGHGVRGGETEMEPLDFVMEAIKRIAWGKRPWNPERASLITYAQWVIRSIISHHLDSAWNRVKLFDETPDDDGDDEEF